MKDSAGVALVTGGSVRIGRAISVALAHAGFDLAIHTRDEGREAHEFAAEIAALGRRTTVVMADLASPASVASLVFNAGTTLGPLTLLVNNVSEFGADELGSLEIAQWDRHFAVNLRAPVFLAQAFDAQLPANGRGCIINITDQRVLKPVPRQFSYSLTKSALHSATIMLAQALAPNVRVNAVAPGPTLPSPRQGADEFAKQSETLPLGAGPRPEDIAAAVTYLATASRVTGETIAVDGGQHIAWKTPDVWGVEE